MHSDRVNETRPVLIEETRALERQSFWQRYHVLILLVGILAIGAFFRFNGRDFDRKIQVANHAFDDCELPLQIRHTQCFASQ